MRMLTLTLLAVVISSAAAFAKQGVARNPKEPSDQEIRNLLTHGVKNTDPMSAPATLGALGKDPVYGCESLSSIYQATSERELALLSIRKRLFSDGSVEFYMINEGVDHWKVTPEPPFVQSHAFSGRATIYQIPNTQRVLPVPERDPSKVYLMQVASLEKFEFSDPSQLELSSKIEGREPC